VCSWQAASQVVEGLAEKSEAQMVTHKASFAIMAMTVLGVACTVSSGPTLSPYLASAQSKLQPALVWNETIARSEIAWIGFH
jgi:hypothetical protein